MPTLAELREKFKKEPMKKGKRDYTLNSRYLMFVYMVDHLGMKYRRVDDGKGGDKLPSMDEKALSKLNNEWADRLIKYRSDSRQFNSFKGAETFVLDNNLFPESAPVKDTIHQKTSFLFSTLGYGLVERIFTKAKQSIPLNLDKEARAAFVVPDTTIDITETTPATQALLASIKE